MILLILILLLTLTGIWLMFKKAGEPGWAAIVPYYNYCMMCKVAGVKNWWLIFIPVVNIYILIVLAGAMAKSFGKGIGFAVGLFFLPFVFFPILGFGKAQYVGPNGIRVSKDDLLQSLGR